MSVLCQKQTYAVQQNALFDHLIGRNYEQKSCVTSLRQEASTRSHTSKSKSANSEEDIVALEPTGHASQWQRINCVDALSPCADIDHQVNSTQYAQMPGYCWPTKWKICSYRTRVGWSASQEIQDRSPSWIGDGVKHLVIIRSLHRDKPGRSAHRARGAGSAALFLLVVLRLRWSPHIGAGDTSYFGYRVIGQIDRLKRLADGFLIWSRHETERLSFLQIDVRGMTKTPRSLAASSSAANCRKNCSSLSSCLGKLPLLLSWVSMKYFIRYSC